MITKLLLLFGFQILHGRYNIVFSLIRSKLLILSALFVRVLWNLVAIFEIMTSSRLTLGNIMKLYFLLVLSFLERWFSAIRLH